jgi:MFS family permease
MEETMSASKPGGSLGYAWFVVAILMVAYVFSFVDRQILNLLVAPIRRDLGISDTQMSLLMGFSFAIFYTILGIPLGRFADNHSRRGLIAVGVILWSVMTALCGTAKAYWQMFLYRVGVGVGEAALSPAAYSMIADYFPREKRATAISVYGMGIYLGAGLAFVLGGLVIQFVTKQGPIDLPVIGLTHPWQFVFLILGAAGVLFSVAFVLVREPPRQGVAAVVPLSEVIAYLWANRRTVLCHNVGFALIAFVSYGGGAWVPTFFIRSFGASPGEVGIIYGLIVMVFGCAGIVFGGRLTDRWLRQGHSDAALRVGVWAAVLTGISHIPLLVVPSVTWAYVALAPAVFFLSMPFGAAPAAIQEVVPNRMRGQTSAIYLFVVNIIGLGIGPTAVALITDYVFGDDAAVRWSILIIALGASVAATATLAAGRRPYRESLQRLHAAG